MKKQIYQIDQSGKIEQTSLDTIIAFSNHIQYCIILPKKVKHLLQKIFRTQQKPRMFIYDTFSALLALVIIKTKLTSKILIDKEYSNEGLIKARILEFLKMHQIKHQPNIEFTLIGKLSPAHILAARIGNKKIQPDLILTLEDMTALLWPIKKTGYSAIDRTKGNLTQDWLPGDRKPSQSSYAKKIPQKPKKVKQKI